MKISIITISYNQGKYIEDCIISTLSQEYKNFEHIIIDGNSTDNTVDILKKYEEKDQRLKFISEKDDGPSSALNKGFKMASGEIFCFINSDDFFLNGALKFINNFFEKNLDTDLLFTGGEIVDEKKNFLHNIYNSNHNKFIYLAGLGEFFQQGMFFRKKLFLKTNGFNETNKISWDGELLIDFLKLKPKKKRFFLKTSAFRIQNESITQNSFYSEEWKKEQKKLFIKNYPNLKFLFENKIIYLLKYLNDPMLIIHKIINKNQNLNKL